MNNLMQSNEAMLESNRMMFEAVSNYLEPTIHELVEEGLMITQDTHNGINEVKDEN